MLGEITPSLLKCGHYMSDVTFLSKSSKVANPPIKFLICVYSLNPPPAKGAKRYYKYYLV